MYVIEWITTNSQSGTPRAYLSEICIDKLTSNKYWDIELKLDSISVISEVAPYPGWFDDIYWLMKLLNNKTNQMLKKTWADISKTVNKKQLSGELFE